jgi:hypothetical protein
MTAPIITATFKLKTWAPTAGLIVSSLLPIANATMKAIARRMRASGSKSVYTPAMNT